MKIHKDTYDGQILCGMVLECSRKDMAWDNVTCKYCLKLKSQKSPLKNQKGGNQDGRI